ncbi:hypothetical protein ACTMTF_48595, partial [Nonomuraea sp. ZG12]|uniref:hypothetical protein n=1 Tax=Nonomuraea sp. ZG12 TaxID=3452207 RepID=UPI003F8B6EF4
MLLAMPLTGLSPASAAEAAAAPSARAATVLLHDAVADLAGAENSSVQVAALSGDHAIRVWRSR